MLYLDALLKGGMNMLHSNQLINKALVEMGFDEFTEIQSKTMPLLREQKDVIGHSQTGTGKTAAFTLPILETIDFDSKNVQALILCPTRELAVQVKTEIDKIGKYLPQLRTVAVYGGEPIHKQITVLKRKPQIVVGTPGRTLDHINRKLIRLDELSYMVLDEADEMMKMGFKDEIEAVFEATNDDRQTVMFSATMPKPIINISKKYMKSPEVISVISGDETNKDITQYYYTVKTSNKVEAIARLLHIYHPQLSLVFCNTKRKVDDVTRELIKKGYNVDKIHGDLPQTTRLDVLNKFHTGVLDMLVATDVAARGLDIKNVEAVINYDVPEKAEYYVHRIGRTGRIGNKGYSFTLVSKNEMSRLDSILRFTKTNIKKRNIPTPDKVLRVKEDKELEDILSIIETENLSSHYDLAIRLLSQSEPENIVSALLSKLEKNDLSDIISGDINEEIKLKGQSQYQKSQNSNEPTVRYHINLGTGVGMNPKSLAEFVCKQTGLRNNDVSDITIRHSFSFFTVNKKHVNKVTKNLNNVKYNGKKASVQEASDKRQPRKRRG